MYFTLVMVACPALLAWLSALTPDLRGELDAFGLLAAFWLWLDMPVLGTYWIVRIVRLALRA